MCFLVALGGQPTPFEVERTRRVHDDLDPGRLGHIVESAVRSDIRHDHNVETLRLVLVRLPELLCLVFRPDRGRHLVALVEELFEDMRYTRVSM